MGESSGEIRIRGVVGVSKKSGEDWFGEYEGEGGTVKEFEADLQALGEVQTLNLYISSEGGYVPAGLAIHSILARHPAKKIVHIDGYAYSIASFIATVGDEVRMPSNALFMIHNASTWSEGDYRDMERTAEALKQHNSVIRKAYAAKSKRDEKEFAALMDATTYMDGETAKALGLVDVVTDEMKLKNCEVSQRFRNSAEFAKMPARWAPFFDISPPATPSASSPPLTSPMKAILALAKALGIALADDATEDQAAAAFAAYKPKEQNAVLNLDDEETKKLLGTAVSNALPAAVKPLEDKITALETENGKLRALITNGAAGAAGGNPPAHVPSGGGNKSKDEQITDLQQQAAACADSVERGRIIQQIRNLRTAA